MKNIRNLVLVAVTMLFIFACGDSPYFYPAAAGNGVDLEAPSFYGAGETPQVCDLDGNTLSGKVYDDQEIYLVELSFDGGKEYYSSEFIEMNEDKTKVTWSLNTDGLGLAGEREVIIRVTDAMDKSVSAYTTLTF